jgi:hypothetical protein
MVAIAAVLALSGAVVTSWRGSVAVASRGPQPHPDPTPAPGVSATHTPDASATASPSASASGDPSVHALPANPSRWPVVPRIDRPMKDRLRAVFLQGQAAGNDPGVFAKVGDSITESKSFLADVGCGQMSLAGHTDLLPAIDVFSQVTFPPTYTTSWCGVANSFTRDSVTAVEGWTAAAPLQPFTGTPQDPSCAQAPYDAPLPCEIHLLRPSIALIMFGTNDVEHASDPTVFAQQLDTVVGACLAAGVIPVLSTIPPRPADSVMDARVQAYNVAIVKIAAAERIPLVNYWRALVQGDTVNDGISGDGVHPNVYGGCAPHCQSTDFSPAGLRYGYNVRNLVSLEALARVLRIVIEDGSPDASPHAFPPR